MQIEDIVLLSFEYSTFRKKKLFSSIIQSILLALDPPTQNGVGFELLTD